MVLCFTAGSGCGYFFEIEITPFMKRFSLCALLCLPLVATQAAPVRFGCQARTFGDGVYKDEAVFLSVVRQIGAVGFEGIETNWKNLERYFDRPAEFSKHLRDARLTLIGAHIGGSPWGAVPAGKLLDDVVRTAGFVKAVGGAHVVFSGAYPIARPLPPDTWAKMAEFINGAGRACAKSGVRLLYHNHWLECEGDGLEQLCRLTDPELVGFAFDTGHAVRAGKDPAAIIALLGNRLGVIHFADASEGGPTAAKRPPLGEGRLQMAVVAAALGTAGFKGWIVLEEETKGAGRPAAERGLAIFRKVFESATR